MPGLDRSIVEHRLPIKPRYQPFKQAPRRFNPNVLDGIKKESERLLEAKIYPTVPICRVDIECCSCL